MILSETTSLATASYAKQARLANVSSSVWHALDVRICTVTHAVINTKARIPSLKITADFGDEFDDLKQSSAQLVDNYFSSQKNELSADGRPKSDLTGMQIAAVTNFPKRNVGIPSFFLILGVVSLEDEKSGTSVVRPSLSCANGLRVKLSNKDEAISQISSERSALVDYASTFDLLDIRLGTVISLEKQLIDFGDEFGFFSYQDQYENLKEGIQVLRIFNLEDQLQKDNLLGVQDHGFIPLTLERTLPNGRFLK
jgi:tRNA-binding protein